MRSIAILMLLAACGGEGPPGPQGVEGPVGAEGPTGPAGSGGGGKITFRSPAGTLQSHQVALGTVWTFDVAEPPDTATALYVETNGCLGSLVNPGAMIRFGTPASGYTVALEPHRPCAGDPHLAADARQTWFPSMSPHKVSAEVLPEFGSVGNPTATVRIIGWYEP